MPWRVKLSRRAQRDLARLPAADHEAVLVALQRLQNDLGNLDIIKLKGTENQWRLRVRGWRVILEMDNVSGEITATRIVARKDAY